MRPSPWVPRECCELGVGPVRPGLHGAERDAEPIGDLGVGHALEVVHADDVRLVGCQLVDRPATCHTASTEPRSGGSVTTAGSSAARSTRPVAGRRASRRWMSIRGALRDRREPAARARVRRRSSPAACHAAHERLLAASSARSRRPGRGTRPRTRGARSRGTGPGPRSARDAGRRRARPGSRTGTVGRRHRPAPSPHAQRYAAWSAVATNEVTAATGSTVAGPERRCSSVLWHSVSPGWGAASRRAGSPMGTSPTPVRFSGSRVTHDTRTGPAAAHVPQTQPPPPWRTSCGSGPSPGSRSPGHLLAACGSGGGSRRPAWPAGPGTRPTR